jgi:hypothetical protein
MSYCRWSSDDFACDLYAYESVGDTWVIHVAGNRVVGDIPKLPPFPTAGITGKDDPWIASYHLAAKAQHEFLETAEREFIDLPFAGESLHCDTLQEFKEKMLMLREIGYNFPDYVLETIEEEMANVAG